MKRLTLITLIFILWMTVPFKFGIIGGERVHEFPKFIPIVIGIFETLAGILLIFKQSRKWGAILSISIFSGAILSHIFVIGIFYGKGIILLAILGLWLSLKIKNYGK